MGQDDGVKRIQGLTALAQRFGVKPYSELLMPDRTWQTERVIFRDVDTGATLVRLTNDPWANELSYFGGNWSSNGKWVVFRRRPGMWEASTGTHGPMAVNSDGTGLRNVFRDYRLVRNEACSPTDPNTCFAVADERKLVAFDLTTGKARQVLREVLGCWHLKVSPDGKYLMGRAALRQGGRGLWVASSDGKEFHEIPIPEAIHDSYQFHPSQKRVMFWYEGRFQEGFVQCDFAGKKMTRVPVCFDWNHGDVGPDRGVHTVGRITRIRGDRWLPLESLFHPPGVEYYDDPHRFNGYVTWSPKDRLWVYATRLVPPPYLSEINAFHAEPVPGDVVNRYRLCYTGLRVPTDLDHPGASPDGTKVLFNASLFGRVDVFYVVARLPEPPRTLRAQRHGSAVRLTWRSPRHHAEIAGYHVYRSSTSGVNYVPLTARPVRATEFTDRTARLDAAAFYAVSAVEHSGLESGLSEEASVGDCRGVGRRIFVEGEQGQRDHLMWLAHDGQASNLHYVWMRGRAGEGRVVLPVNVPETAGPWVVWGRVKGEQGVQFRASAGGSASLRAPPLREWNWVRFAGTLAGSGKVQLRLTSSLYGSAIDCLVLSSDPGFSPTREPRIRWPKLVPSRDVTARAVSPYSVRLSWPAVAGDTLHHYNLYCGRQRDFPTGPSTLVASPDRSPFLDWGLQPGLTYYYRLTCVGRAGNESPASPSVRVRTPEGDRVALEPAPATRVAFRTPRQGLYVLWLKLRRGAGRGQYVNLTLDGKRVTWTITFDNLAEESWFTYDQWGRFPLAAGTHVLAIENNTRHVVRQVLLTTDLAQKPEGHVNLLRGW
jgi:fibronectin type 3 domain-containing protein